MTNQETAKIITIIQSLYPNAYKGKNESDMANIIFAWGTVLSDYPYGVVEKAVKQHALTSDSSYPPAVTDLTKIIREWTKDPKDEITAQEAWSSLVRVMQSGDFHYEPQKTFDKLPELLRKSVGSAAELKRWALMDLSELEFVKNNYIKSFNELKEIHEKRAALPEVVLTKLPKLNNLLEAIGN